jgi:hypothetical protein
MKLFVGSQAVKVLATAFLLHGVALAQHPDIEVTNVRRVFHNGQHNAFTDLIHWKGKYWLTFRSCPDGHMVHPTASIIILSSDDAKNWKTVHQFVVAKRDTRDPHFLAFKGKLFVYTGTWYCGDSSPDRSAYTLNRHLGYAAWSEDGDRWHSPVMLEGTFGHYIWRANVFGDKAYLCGRRNHQFEITARGEGETVESAMLESDDGLVWKTRALFQEDHGDETAFFFERDGSVFAIGRGSGGPAEIIRSPPPYTAWTRRDLDRNVGGPLVVKWADRIVVAGRKYGKPGATTSFYWLDPDAESTGDLLTEFAELPSGGDNSYPGLVPVSPTKAIVSWYSSHERDDSGNTITAIYMADMEVKLKE